MFSISYTNEANTDLDNAISYIAKHNVASALAYLDRIKKKIDLLKSNPFMGLKCINKSIKRNCRRETHNRL